jgi:kumamolisin
VPQSDNTSAVTHAGEHWVSDAPETEQVSVTLLLRPPAGQAERLLSGQHGGAATAAQPEDVAAARAFAKQYGLEIKSEDPESKRIVLAGTAAQLQKAFGVQIGQAEDNAGHRFRSYRGTLQTPAFATAVLGLDQKPVAHRPGH